MTRRYLYAVWCCFIAQGVFYATVTPLWEGFDEFSHYAFLEDIALHGRLAQPGGAFVSREVADSLRTAPVPWMIRQWQPGWISYDRFWKLSEAERAERLARLRSIPIARADESDPARIRNYEAQQPPLAYAILAGPFLLLRGATLPDRVWALRLVCVLIASAVVPFTFLAVRDATGSEWRALAGASLAAAFPEVCFDVARVGNEALAVALGSALVWLLVRSCARQQPRFRLYAGVGIVLACALLTKAYFLPVAIAAFGIIAAKSAPAPVRLKRLAVCAVVPIASAGWWYIRAYRLTGSLTGEQSSSSALKSGILGSAALHASWPRIVDFALLSHIWLGDWSFLVVRTWMYRAVEVLFALALVGLLFRMGKLRAPVRAAVVIEGAFCAALALHAVAAVAGGGAGAFGYYAFAILPAEIICLLAGWSGLGKTMSGIGPFATAATLSAIGIFGLVVYAMPYWAGVTAHDARGNLHAIPFHRIAGALPLELRNLSWGRPPALLLALLVCFVAASLLNCAINWRAQRNAVATAFEAPPRAASSDDSG